MPDRYEVFRGEDGWYIRRRAGNGEIVMSSEGHENHDDALSEAHRQADPAGLLVVEVQD